MDKLLNGITDLNQYTIATQQYCSKPDALKVRLNLSTVQALRKIQHFEIQYFHKYKNTGIAVAVFDDLLVTPLSETWTLLGKQMIFILQYWLEALRKQLLDKSLDWWIFLKTLLIFLKMLRQKHNSFPNILVQETGEYLLDLATNAKVDLLQKYEIVNCFNLYCAASSREVRVIMKKKLDKYFCKLSTIMSTCGHFPTQLSMLETLLRWTIGRQDLLVRRRAADNWLPTTLFNKNAVDLFLARKWNDFSLDARDFLNKHNSVAAFVTSVVCKKLVIDNIIIVSGLEKKEVWLDLNSSTKCITLMLEPRYLAKLVLDTDSCYETLTINESDVADIQLIRISEVANITINISKPIELRPSMVEIVHENNTMTITVAKFDNFEKINVALLGIFGDAKYKLLPPNSTLSIATANTNTKEDEFLHTPEVQTRRRAGYMVRPRYDPLRSPSTASTSSLAQLPQKLAALPRYRFDKEPVSVCAQPELSNVTELTEPEDRSSFNSTTSTFKLRRCGVFIKKTKDNAVEKDRRSKSDGELRKPDKTKEICISPVIPDENSVSCLLVATIGSEESVINATIERLPKDKACTTDNIIDMLVQEALQAKAKDREGNDDSGINTEVEKTHEINSDVVENTPYFEINPKPSTSGNIKCKDKNYTLINQTTSSDESNAEEINEVPETPINYVSSRSKKPARKAVNIEENVSDCQIVENFFSQHFSENPVSELIISPTIAKKINESTSNDGEDFHNNILENYNNDDGIIPFNEEDVFNCLNSLIDKVCDDLQKSTKYLSNDRNESAIIDEVKKIATTEKVREIKTVKKKQPAKNNSIKLKFLVGPKTERNPKARAKKMTTKPKLVTQAKMSTINEADDEVIDRMPSTPPESPAKKNPNSSPNKTSTDSDIGPLRRKRKLYSPKEDDEEMGTEVTMPKITIPETCEESNSIVKSKSYTIETSKSVSTPYKEIEKERKKIRKQRNRKATSSSKPLSPRSIKMNEMFDHLKDKIESNESITLVDKNKEGIYNFTSDSDDEDFKKKKIEIKKRVSATTISSFDSTKSTKRSRKVTRVNYTENKSDSAVEDNQVQKPRRKRSKRLNPKTKKMKVVESVTKDLVDEKMRCAPDVLNTSLIENHSDENLVNEPEPIINVIPEMETITDKPHDNTNMKKTQKILSIKKELGRELSRNKNTPIKTNEESVSPLPGLVVETVQKTADVVDGERSLTPNMIKKLKKIYKEGPNFDYNNTNTTQNLLSDVEKINCSPELNITEEVNRRISEIIEIEDLTNFAADSNKENKPAKRNTKRRKNTTSLKRNKYQTDKKIELINISVESIHDEDDVGKSIDTNGRSPITAHGDSNEKPPSPGLLNKTVIPRNLEVQDLDASTAKYFLKLTREANESGDNFYSCDERTSDTTNKNPTYNSNDNSKDTRSTNKSPLIRLMRLSSGDIHKWLPSPRSNDSGDEDSAPESVVIETHKTASKEKLNILEKRDVKKTGITTDKSLSDLSEIKAKRRKTAKQETKTPKAKSFTSKDISRQQNELQGHVTNSSPIIQKTNARKTIISPIKLTFDDAPCVELPSDKSNSGTLLQITPKERSDSKTSETQKYSKMESTSRYFLRNASKLQPSPDSRTKASNKSDENVKTTSPIKTVSDKITPKKRVFEIDNEEILYTSGPSVLSVNEWVKSITNSHQAESATSHCNEVIDTVMEKLDTTLAEIHESTSKKFIGLFVNAQQQLQSQRKERHKLYEETAKEMLKKFEDLEKKSQEMEVQFMQYIKKQSCNLVREDNKQKRAMVVLLKEDLQAVVDHMSKQKRTE